MSFTTFSKRLFASVKAIILNKYLIVLVTFGIYITFFDQHSLISRYQSQQKIKELEIEYQYYQSEISKNKQLLHKLKTDNQFLEQFARENYLMRNKGEEIFIIKD